MHRLNPRPILVGLVPVLLLGVAVVVAVAVQKRGDGSDAVSAQTIAERAKNAAVQMVAELGPNSTFHQDTLRHEQSGPAPGPWVLPPDRREELWATFGPDGALTAYADLLTDPSRATVFQRVQLVDGSVINSDIASGESHTVPGFNLTAEGLRANLTSALSQELALQQTADAPPPPHASIRGRDTYVLSHVNPTGSTDRLYVDATSFRPVRQETIAVDGSVLDSSDLEVFEVLTLAGEETMTAYLATVVPKTQTPAAPESPISDIAR